jgi:hypothetical protein
VVEVRAGKLQCPALLPEGLLLARLEYLFHKLSLNFWNTSCLLIDQVFSADHPGFPCW